MRNTIAPTNTLKASSAPVPRTAHAPGSLSLNLDLSDSSPAICSPLSISGRQAIAGNLKTQGADSGAGGQ